MAKRRRPRDIIICPDPHFYPFALERGYDLHDDCKWCPRGKRHHFDFETNRCVRRTEGNTLKKYHKWTKEDDIVTLYLYKFGDGDLPFSLEDIGEKLGMGVSSLRMRIANFKAIDGKGGLEHFGTQSLKIYKKYKGTSEDELRSLVLKIMERVNYSLNNSRKHRKLRGENQMEDDYRGKEERIREILSRELNTHVRKGKLVIGYRSDGSAIVHEFDIVAKTEEGLIIGEVKASRYGTEARFITTKFHRVLTACVYLGKVKAVRKLLILTERKFYERFKEESDGLIDNDIELRLMEL